MTNYSILQRNILASLDTNEGKIAFLKAQDQPHNDHHSYFAEKIAREVDLVCSIVAPAIEQASGFHCVRTNADQQKDLLKFMLKRHWHWRMPIGEPVQ